ncbi:MAG: hypothetical protein R3E61_05700 [Pseudomonadales bacterium]
MIHGQRFFVVADDDLHLSMFRLDDVDYFQAVRLLAGELPAEKKARKAAKPDFEALALYAALQLADCNIEGALVCGE